MTGTIVLLSAMTLPAGIDRRPALADGSREAKVGPLPPGLDIHPFYKKHTDALGISVLSSERVPVAALLAARETVIHMLAKRPDVRQALVARKHRVVVMAQSESTTDLPEQRDWKKPRRDRLTGKRGRLRRGDLPPLALEVAEPAPGDRLARVEATILRTLEAGGGTMNRSALREAMRPGATLAHFEASGRGGAGGPRADRVLNRRGAPRRLRRGRAAVPGDVVQPHGERAAGEGDSA